jgi:hypothetical protein
MNNTNIKLDSKDLGKAALAWQSPNLVSAVGHEARSTVWMGVILLGLLAAVGYVVTYPKPSGGVSKQEIHDYRQATIAQCVSNLMGQGYTRYQTSNCYNTGTVKTYERYGKLSY